MSNCTKCFKPKIEDGVYGGDYCKCRVDRIVYTPEEQQRQKDAASKMIQAVQKSQNNEYRELVKTFAGQMMAGMLSNPNYDPSYSKYNLDESVALAHALAKAVVESFKENV